MEKKEIFCHIDHTVLKPDTSWGMVENLCEEAVKYQTASVCIPPCYVGAVKEKFGNRLTICTVIGFPAGYSVTGAKVAETEAAVADGAQEIDMVINLTYVKDKKFDLILQEIKAVKTAAAGKLLKVIVETCFLTEEEIVKLCEIVTEAGADYIKTSTGFGSRGASREDICLFKAHIGPGVKMKASGGIRTLQDIEDYLELGCERIGTSQAVSLLKD